jgi:hypothetical protein
MLETLSLTRISLLLVSEETLLAEYIAYRQAAGYAQGSHVWPWGARAFLRRYPDLDSWRVAPLEEQLGLHRSLKYFAYFLFLKHYLRPTMAYLLTARPQLALVAKRYLYTQIYTQFYQLGRQLGYAESVVESTIGLLFYVMAHAGKPADMLTEEDVQTFDREMRAYRPPAGHPFSHRMCSCHLYRVRLLLFHAGILPKAPRRYQSSPARSLEESWEGIPTTLGQVVWRYLDQLRAVRARDTVSNIEGYLRRFFGWLARTHPEVTDLHSITRSQIEEFKLWLRDSRCATGKPYHVHTVASTPKPRNGRSCLPVTCPCVINPCHAFWTTLRRRPYCRPPDQRTISSHGSV